MLALARALLFWHDVPINCTAVGVPSRNVCECNTATTPLEHAHLPDIEADTLQRLLARIEQLGRPAQQS